MSYVERPPIIILFYCFFGEDIHMSYFGATGTPVLDFWISGDVSTGFQN